MEEQILSLLAENFGPLSFCAVFVIAGTAILKRVKKLANINPRYISAGLCLICGVSYTLITTFVAPEILTRMSAFGVSAFAFATGLYKLSK